VLFRSLACNDVAQLDELFRRLPIIRSERLCRGLVRHAWPSGSEDHRRHVAERLRREGSPILDRLAGWARSKPDGEEDPERLASAAVAALHAIGTPEALDRLDRLAASAPPAVADRIAGLIGRLGSGGERGRKEARRWFDYRLSRGRLSEVEAALDGPHGEEAAAALFDRWPGLYRRRARGGAWGAHVPMEE